jgi:hypothetical protein
VVSGRLYSPGFASPLDLGRLRGASSNASPLMVLFSLCVFFSTAGERVGRWHRFLSGDRQTTPPQREP